MPTRLRPLVLLLVLALVAAGCGGDDDQEAAEGADARSSTTLEDGTGGGEPGGAAGGDDDAGSTSTSSSSTSTSAGGGAASSSGGGTTGGDGGGPGDERAAGVNVPAPGRYVYATSGYTETGEGPTAEREEAPARTTDDVSVTQRPNGTEVETVTSGAEGRSQETTLLVTAEEARITRIAFRDESGPTPQQFAINPQPPILVSRFPYEVGDRWEIAWEDPSLGIRAEGTGAVLRREQVTVPAGTFDAFVLEIDQRLSGTATGRMTSTVWIDPETGVQVRDESSSDTRSPAGRSRSESTRLLQETPSG